MDLRRRSDQNRRDIFALFEITNETNGNVKMLGHEVRHLGRRVDGLDREVKHLSGRVNGLEQEVKHLGQEVKGLGTKVDGLDRGVKHLGQEIKGVGGNVVSLAERSAARFDVVDRTLADVLTLLGEGKAGA